MNKILTKTLKNTISISKINWYSVESRIFSFKQNRFNDVHVYANELNKTFEDIKSNESEFETILKNSLNKWKLDGKTSAWLHVPIGLSNLITISSKYGFKYHHAEDNLAVLCIWLASRESKIPRFATHQLGVSGLVYRKETDEVLLIKDKHAVKSVWKVPGGSADLGEFIEDTAVREVYEETGIKTKFCSIIGFRQQHDYPGAYGRSDLYVVCRLEPLTFNINACNQEILQCEWHKLDKVCNYTENNLLQRVAKLLLYAKNNNYNYDLIDINAFKMKSIIVDKFYSFYHKNLPHL